MRWALKIAETHWFDPSGMNQPAVLKSIVPLAFSVKSTTCVPCEYQAMKIRFWPGICCITCDVQTDACGIVRMFAR